MPTVRIYSQPNNLIPVLAYHLQALHLRVTIETRNPNSWKQPHKNIFTDNSGVNKLLWDYTIVCAPLPKTSQQRNANQRVEWNWFLGNLPKVAKTVNQQGSKLLVILPLILPDQKIFPKIKKLLDKLESGYVKIVWVGEVFSPDLNLAGQSMSATIMESITYSQTVALAHQHYLLISSSDASAGIAKTLLSYWHQGNPEVWAVTDKISRQSLVEAINKTYPYLGITSLLPPRKFYQLPLPKNLISPKTATVDQFVKISQKLPKNLPKPKPKTYSRPTISFPRLKPKAVVIGLFIVALPVLFFLTSVLISYTGFKVLVSGNYKIAQKLFLISTPMSQIANSTIGLVDPIGRETQTLVKLNQIGIDSASAAGHATKIYKQITGVEEYDLEFYSHKLSLGLDSLYTQTSFLESQRAEGAMLVSLLPDRETLTEARKLLLSGRDLVSRLPLLLSGEGVKTYLVLMQDTQQLRPTGGAINKIVLLSFQNGKLVNTQEIQTEELDKRLTGQISPPAALGKYLKTTQWLSKDSNWDPNFVVSAQRAEWFLENGLSQKVEGVVAINQPLVVPLRLDDLINSLNKRNILVYSHDPITAGALSRLGWDGKVVPPNCPNNCTILPVVAIEANAGQLDRQSHLKIQFQKNTVNFTLTVDYTAPSQDYTGYLRVLGPKGSLFRQIKLTDSDKGKLIKQTNPDIASSGDFVDAGVAVDIPKGESRSVVFDYSIPATLDFSRPGSLGFYWRKQPGISVDNLSLEVVTPQALYWDAPLAYNTDLEDDFFSLAYW